MWWFVGCAIWILGVLFIWAVCYAGGKADEAMEKEIERMKQQRDHIEVIQEPKEPEVTACGFDK
jgi:hypothetical protein